MSCNCNNIYPNEDLNRWSVCQSIDILENYYTKGEVDAKIADIEVDVDLSNYYNKQEVDDKLDLKANASDLSALNTTVGQLSATIENKADKSEIPSLNGYATEQWVENKNYLTTHQPLKTINNQSLIGEGNITISGGGSADLSNYYNKQEIDRFLSNAEGILTAISGVVDTKADAADTYTKTEVDNLLSNKPDASNVYTKTEVNNLVNNKFWCGTQSQYDALTNKENDVLYLIYEV